jgi:hydroxypyruvate reductase
MLPEDFEKAIAMGLNARKHLDQHATADYFEGMDRLLITGPTQTNVNDLRVILIGEPLRPTH